MVSKWELHCPEVQWPLQEPPLLYPFSLLVISLLNMNYHVRMWLLSLSQCFRGV